MWSLSTPKWKEIKQRYSKVSNRLEKLTSRAGGFVRRARTKFQSCANDRANPPRGAKAGPRPGDYIIAVMGPTGAGKSTFISTATGCDNGVGHGLQSVTSQVSAVRTTSPSGADVVLVDTPGFDDTYMSDLEILKIISKWLEDTYRSGVTLSGILYLHRISDNRMAGTPLKNLEMFKKLCGEDGFHKVALVTTIWRDVEKQIGLDRQDELRGDYWAEMVKRGSTIKSFNDTRESGWAILDSLINCESRKRSIRIQEELVDLSRDLPNTAAGQQLYGLVGNLIERQKDLFGRIKAELEDATDPAVIQALVDELHELRKQRGRAMADIRQLDSSAIKKLLRLFCCY